VWYFRGMGRRVGSSVAKIVNFFYEVGTLRKVARSHRQTLLADDLSDNIASHSFRVSIIGYFLAQMEKVDSKKVAIMCLFHDVGEARSGDQNWLNKRYVKVYEEEIHAEQLARLPLNEELMSTTKEYAERKTLEARIAKDADLLDQILLLKEYAWRGNREATAWLVGAEQAKRLMTKSGKKLAREIVRQKPSDWWKGLWTDKRR